MCCQVRLLCLAATILLAVPAVAQVQSGTYVGNATDSRAIYVGFQPDVVILDMDEVVTAFPDEAVIRTSTMGGDASKDMDNAAALAADKIQSLDVTGFTVGTHASVNGAGLTYHWVAFRAAPGKLKVGSYAGNGVDNTSITGVGFQPEYVIVMPASTANTTHRSSAMPGDITREFDALSFPDGIQALEADGFQVGLDSRVNANLVGYYYAAWNASPGEVAVGVYTGDGIDGKTIPGLGFLPEEVLVHRSGISGPTHKPASTGVSVDRSLLFNNRLGETNNIQALLPDGFQVGGNTRVNAPANTYYWVAFGPHAPQTNYRSIGTALDVSGTLSATQGSVEVTDLTATWQTANRGRGDRINIGGTNYTVLAVDSQTQLRLTTPFAAATGPYAYTISRQFTTLQAWEDCIDGGGSSCGVFPAVPSSNLIADDRVEVGIAYNDTVFPLTSTATFDGSTTDATHGITLTADPGNRHNGVAGAGVVIDGQDGPNRLRIQDNYVTVEWLEFVRVRGAINIAAVVVGSVAGGDTGVVVQNVLVHNFFDAVNDVSGIRLTGGAGKSATVRNSMVWDGDSAGIEGDDVTDTLTIENCSVDGIPGSGIDAKDSALTIRNTIVTTSSSPNYAVGALGSLSGSNNTSSDGTAPGSNPQTATALSVFVTPNVNLHLRSGANVAVDSGLDLSGSFSNDVDGESRLGVTWDRGADERDAAVTQPYHIHYRSIGTNAAILYSTGNASVTAGSTTVTFGGGAFLPTNLGQGDRIAIGGEELFLLSRDSSTQVTLQEPATVNHSLDVYAITRAFNTLQSWETARQGNLVAADHAEVGVAYNDGPFTSGLTFDGSTTDATHFLRLTVAPGHRHNGTDVVGVTVDGLNTLAGEIYIRDDHVAVEGLVLKRTLGAGGAAIKVDGNNVLLQGLVIYSNESGIRMTGGGNGSFTVRNSFLYFNNAHGIRGNLTSDSVSVENCTLYSNGGNGIDEGAGTDFTVTNTISLANGASSFLIPSGTQSYNMSSDPTATGVGSLTNRVAGDQFVEIAIAPLNLHLKPTSEAIEAGTSLSSSFADDIDSDSRPRGSRWDMGADEYGVGAGLSLSSAANQTFFVGSASQFTATMTIADDAAIATVTTLKDIRIRIPAGFPMMWDPTAASATIGGPAFFRVDPQVKALEDSGHTVVLDVVSDFAPGDQITITGLKFYSFTAPAMVQSLELEVENDGTTSAYDDKTVAISPSASPTLSSDSSQLFVVGSPPVPAVPFTVSEGTTPAILSGKDIRVRIPAGLNMTWDSLISSIVVTGAAATKVSSGVFYENLDGTLVIDVLTDFVPGDFVVVSGLSFMGFAGPPSSSSLELEVDNAGGVIDWDDKTITIDVASDVKVFAATATDSRVELHWVYPEFGACVRVLIMRDEGDFPTPFTGTLVHDDVCGVAGTAVSLVDPNVTSNGIEYFYSAFVDHGSGYTPGKLVTVRPFDTSLEVKWAYSTGATSMAPPGLRIQSGSSFVYAVSNDSILHSLTGGDPGGDWPPAWTPYKLGAPAQTRSPVVNFNVGGANGAAFLGSQDGQVYAIDAVTGALKWKEPIASMVQAAPAGHFLAYKPSAYDLVLVGTRNSSGANSFEAVYVHDGTPRWSFTNSLTQGGNGAAMGIISGGAAIDYTNPRAYFASRGKAGGSSRTLWCIGFNGTSVTLLWNASLGNIDGSPVLFGGRVYVGTNGGVLYALNATTGLVYWSLPLGDGAIKGFPFPRFGSNHLIVSTNNKIWSIEDRGTSGAVDPGWPVSDIPSPSIPLQVPGSQVVLVGSSDGKLYQLDVLVPLPPKSVQLGDGTFAVGAPTMDVLTSMIYVGTDAGVVYGVAFPLP